MRRGLSLWNPFAELERIRREFDRLMEEFTPVVEVERVLTPALDIYETGEEIVVKRELRGFKREDEEVSIKDNILYIRGEKKEVKQKNIVTTRSGGGVYGNLERWITLPKEVKLEGIKAEFKDGVLEIRLPKAETAKETKIEIK